MAGVTLSTDFPVKNPMAGQESLHLGGCATYNDCMDGFVANWTSREPWPIPPILAGAVMMKSLQ